VDSIAINDRAKPPEAVWQEASRLIMEKYINVPVTYLKKATCLNRVHYVRSGGFSSDQFRTIETPELALTSNRMTFFLGYVTPLFEGTVKHKLGLWGHPALFSMLKRPQVQLFIDATFRLVPKPFRQLLIIMLKDTDRDLYVPAFYILMSGKTKFLYLQALGLLKLRVGSKVSPGSVCCDFEVALTSAVKGSNTLF
jgi:hypothetical protein